MKNRFYGRALKVANNNKVAGNIFRRFAAAEEGNVILIFAFALLALLTAAGVAVDMTRVQAARTKLSGCLDTAGLATISRIGTVPAGQDVNAWAQKQVAKYFWVDCPPNDLDTEKTTVTAQLSADNNLLTLNVVAQEPMRLMKLVGIPFVQVTMHSQVKRTSDNTLEVAMVLDNTGSMGLTLSSQIPTAAKDSKMAALQTAANNFVDILLGNNTAAPANMWVGIVPFAQAVNIGTNNKSWVDFTNAQDYGPTTGLNGSCMSYNGKTASTTPFMMPATSATCYYDNVTPGQYASVPPWGTNNWYGCVSARKGPYDLSDDVPSSKRFPAYYYPSIDSATILSDYGSYPQMSSNFAQMLANPWLTPPTASSSVLKYETPLLPVVSSPPPPDVLRQPQGPNAYCTTPITLMTHDKATLKAGIDAMTPNGNTMIPMGLVWGWHMLSQSWRGTWGGDMGSAGLPYDDNNAIHYKAIVFMTDGFNSFFPGSYSSYGMLKDKQVGTDDQAQAELMLDYRTLDLCNRMKNKGIIIYTIGFGLTDNKTSFAKSGTTPDINGTLLSACASQKADGTPYYYLASSQDGLVQAFQNIARTLLDPRVVK